jgi:hypothetical protein
LDQWAYDPYRKVQCLIIVAAIGMLLRIIAFVMLLLFKPTSNMNKGMRWMGEFLISGKNRIKNWFLNVFYRRGKTSMSIQQ